MRIPTHGYWISGGFGIGSSRIDDLENPDNACLIYYRFFYFPDDFLRLSMVNPLVVRSNKFISPFFPSNRGHLWFDVHSSGFLPHLIKVQPGILYDVCPNHRCVGYKHATGHTDRKIPRVSYHTRSNISYNLGRRKKSRLELTVHIASGENSGMSRIHVSAHRQLIISSNIAEPDCNN